MPAKTKKGKATVLPPDPVSQAVHQIEKLSADAALQMANNLVDDGEFSTFKLGGVFSIVNKNKFFAEYGHNDFKTWVEKDYGIRYRKAMYLLQIYEQIVEHNLS